MGKVPSALEAEIAGEKAAALGRSGQRLAAALDKLRRFDSSAKRPTRGGSGSAARGARAMRAELVAQAGDAYWSYVVQREALGLIHNESVVKDYGIPPEVARCMRPKLDKHD